MNRQKKIFLIISIIFFLLMAYIAWDFSRKTEFRKFGPEKEQQQP